MSQTWYSGDAPEPLRMTGRGWLRVVVRVVPLGLVVFGGLALLLLVRLVERPLSGPRRPVTPWITQGVCRMAFVIMGISYTVRGQPMRGPGAVVANHSSWLDIFALNARARVYFVAKAEVAGWLGIGWLARATGTLFIRRDRAEVAEQVGLFRDRLQSGQTLVFFPEGTSTDGLRVLPFKPALFAAFLDPVLRKDLQVQPVSVLYRAPTGADPRFYGWWGTMDFAPHLLAVLAAGRQGGVSVIYHPPLAVAQFADRKALAFAAAHLVRGGVMSSRPGVPEAL